MALDGTVVSALKEEFKEKLCQGRIYKISQPEEDELILTVKGEEGQFKLKLSVNPSLPYVALIEDSKPAPLSAPNFCMLLRKHLQNGRISEIRQPGLERIIVFVIEHFDELGDLRKKNLIIELMGKHSNIILTDEDNTILDSIKHISAMISSVREVLPGRAYFIPDTMEKQDPFSSEEEGFVRSLRKKPFSVSKALYSCFTGISPLIANELIYRSGIRDIPANDLKEEELRVLYGKFKELLSDITGKSFSPCLIYDGKKPVEFSAFVLKQYSDMLCKPFSSVSALLNTYYSERDIYVRIRQKSSDLRKIVQTLLDRSVKKLELQTKQLRDTEKMDKYRIYGELINTYGYGLEKNSKSLTALNYYDNEEITIPLDEDLTPLENAKKYFDRYVKLKRTKEALTGQLEETRAETEHLSSILMSLELSKDEASLAQIKEELNEFGYIKKHDSFNNSNGKKERRRKNEKSSPYHYISSDGFDIYVGKNNYQNDIITFETAKGNDWWFHAKKIPGSHVVLKSEGKKVPDRAFEEAGALAAYYSRGRNQGKVEIDYVQKKEVKKPAKAKPGFVVYYTNYSLIASTDISALKLMDQ